MFFFGNDSGLLGAPTAESIGIVASQGLELGVTGDYTVYFSAATGSGAGGEPIPEPGTLALLGLGAAAAGLAKRRRQKRAAA